MEPPFDHEKLDVYCLELQFVAWIGLFEDLFRPPVHRRRELFEQLDRASLSALPNTAEGNAKRHGRQMAKFFDDARGSAIEYAACLVGSEDRVEDGLRVALLHFPFRESPPTHSGYIRIVY